MGPKNALDGTGLMLASGDRARFDTLAPFLEKMTGKLTYLGPAPERAAATKLLGNLFLMTMIGGLTDTLALAKALLPTIAKEMDRWIDKGHSKDDWTVIAKEIVAR